MRKKIDDKANRPSAAGIAALDIAIALAGGQSAFATRLGIPNTTISQWRTRFFKVPLDHVPAIVAMANDARVTPHSLRPDYAAQWSMLAPQLVYVELIRLCERSIGKKATTATVNSEEPVEA